MTKRKKILRIIWNAYMILIVILLGHVIANYSHPYMKDGFDTKECYELSSGWQYIEENGTHIQEVTLPVNIRVPDSTQSVTIEHSLPQFINRLVAVFSEVRRVLSDDGTLWLNIGDGYTSGNRGWRAPDKKNPARAMDVRPDTPEGLKPKDLLGVPWRLAFALQQDGWYLRSDIVWNKPNAMPESVKDRPVRAHEYIFMLTKSEKYFYDWGALREPADNGGLRSKRTVWNVNTKPFAGAHFATFPPDLIRPCVLASSQPGDYVLDPFFGSGTVGLVCRDEERHYLGIELNPEYVALAAARLHEDHGRVTRIQAA